MRCAGELVHGGKMQSPLLDPPNHSGPSGPGCGFFCLLWTQVMLSSPFGFLLAGEGIFLNSVSGNFDSGLSEIPGTESLKFRLLHGFPGHVLFFCLEILYQGN